MQALEISSCFAAVRGTWLGHSGHSLVKNPRRAARRRTSSRYKPRESRQDGQWRFASFMTYKLAQILGALLAVAVVGLGVAVSRSLPPACHGAIQVELRPPLKVAGDYGVRLTTSSTSANAPECAFEFRLSEKTEVLTNHCELPWQLQLRNTHGHLSISGLLIGARTDHLHFELWQRKAPGSGSNPVNSGSLIQGLGGAEQRNAVLDPTTPAQPGELLYDAQLTPNYGVDLAQRPEHGDARFCGPAALLKPACIRGSAQCAPFAATCDGPEDCAKGQVCCAAPSWGMEYGANNAIECSSRGQCTGRIDSYVACHADPECDAGYICSDDPAGAEFEPKLKLCLRKP
jgi:hypothetical protein